MTDVFHVLTEPFILIVFLIWNLIKSDTFSASLNKSIKKLANSTYPVGMEIDDILP